jgi:hypothetical protein
LGGIGSPSREMKRRSIFFSLALLAAAYVAAPAAAQGVGPVAPGSGLLAFHEVTVREGSRAGVRSFSAYPNPAADDLTVRFTLERAQRVDLAVFDLLGRRLRGWDLGLLPAGEQAHHLDLSGLPAGLYVVRLTGDAGARATVKVTRRPSA